MTVEDLTASAAKANVTTMLREKAVKEFNLNG